MKKIIVIFLVYLFYTHTAMGVNSDFDYEQYIENTIGLEYPDIGNKDSAKIYRWYNEEWEKNERYLYKYNSSDLLISCDTYHPFGNEWFKYSVTERAYDDNNFLVAVTNISAINNEYKPLNKELHFYGFDDIIDSILYYENNQTWRVLSAKKFWHDEFGRLYQIDEQSGKDTLINRKRFRFKYNIKEQLQEMIVFRFSDSTWSQLRKYNYYYNDVDSVIHIDDFGYNNNNWKQFGEKEFYYTNNLLDSVIASYFDSTVSAQNINNRLTYLRDNQGRIIEFNYIVYSDSDTTNRPSSYEYFTDSLISFHYEIINADTFIIYKGVIYNKRYFTDIEDDFSGFDNNLFVYPNPAGDYVEIRGMGDVKTYDVLGNVVIALGDSRFRGNDMRGRGNDMKDSEGESIRLDISALAPGVYFVKVGGKVSKFVKM